MDVVAARGRAARLTDALAGCPIPALALRTFKGTPVALARDTEAGTVIYLHPAASCSPDGGAQSTVEDAAQHRAFDRHRDDLAAYGFRAVGLSSASQRAQVASVVKDRICHELWSDQKLLLAAALGLPTFDHEGASWYRRLTIIARAGRIEKAFFPVESPSRSALQVIWWLRATGR